MNEQHEKQIRFVSGFILAAVVVLLLGAGRIGDSMLSRHQTLEKAQRECESAVRTILSCEKRENTSGSREIHKLAMEDPVTFLSIVCGKLETAQH